MTEKLIEKNLFPVSELNLLDDFVSLSVTTNSEGDCDHTGILVCLDEQLFYFHFYGDVKLEDITDTRSTKVNFYSKHLTILNSHEVSAFLGHCQELKRDGFKPLYGFVFDNSYYDPNNKESYLVNAIHDITTCVGFCIKVIRGFSFNHDEYIDLSDWTSKSLSEIDDDLKNIISRHLEKYALSNGLSVQELYDQKNIKRVMPSELISSGFFDDLPISKKDIDTLRPTIEEYLKKIA